MDENAVEIPATTHGDTTVRKEVDPPTDAFGNSDIKGASTQVEDQEHAIRIAGAHDAHDCSYRFLHKVQSCQDRPC